MNHKMLSMYVSQVYCTFIYDIFYWLVTSYFGASFTYNIYRFFMRSSEAAKQEKKQEKEVMVGFPY